MTERETASNKRMSPDEEGAEEFELEDWDEVEGEVEEEEGPWEKGEVGDGRGEGYAR